MSVKFNPRTNLGKLASLASHIKKRKCISINIKDNKYKSFIVYICKHSNILNLKFDNTMYKVDLRNLESILLLPKYSIKLGDCIEFIRKENKLYCIWPKPYEPKDWTAVYSYKYNRWYWWHTHTNNTSWKCPINGLLSYN